MRKKRILAHSEFSRLNSGYAIYFRNVLERLYTTGKYEIAEFANFVSPEDPRILECKWKVYPVMPSRDDIEGQKFYNQNPIAKMGVYKFEDVCLDFKPDIIWDISDYWYSYYIQRSPFRRLFKFVWMPTVDSKPQRPCWIDTYSCCDKVLAYSYFGKNVLESESNGRIKDVLVASPGVEDEFSIAESKDEIRKCFGVPKDIKIVMMVARNQKRKLIPDFLKTLSTYKNKYGKKDPKTVDNTYFYIHTSNPDRGWDLYEAALRSGHINRILATYVCNKCRAISIKPLDKIVCKCPRCGAQAMTMTCPENGIGRKDLAAIMKIADIGCLMSIGEGWGMPVSEFKKVGVPVITVPYSAMEEQCVDISGDGRHKGGIPVNIERMFTEAETMQERALFDKSSLAKRIYEVLTLPKIKYENLCNDAKWCGENIFSWDKTAAVWEKVFDEMNIDDLPGWDSEPLLYQERINVPNNIASPYAIVEYLTSITNHPFFTPFRKKEFEESIITRINKLDGEFSTQKYHVNDFVNFMKGFIEKNNMYEKKRTQKAAKEDNSLGFGVI